MHQRFEVCGLCADTEAFAPSAVAAGTATATGDDATAVVVTDASMEEKKEEAFEEAESFSVGSPVTANAELVATGVVTDEAEDPEIRAIAEDPDFIEEGQTNCCGAGSFCCGMELGCLPDALAPRVQCAVRGPGGPQRPCCNRNLP